MISVAVELSKQRLEWLVYDTPFNIKDLEEEVVNQRQGAPTEEDLQMKKIMKEFKVEK